MLSLRLGSTHQIYILAHARLRRDRVFKTILLVQVLPESNEILLVSSSLKLEIDASDPLKLRFLWAERFSQDTGLGFAQNRFWLVLLVNRESFMRVQAHLIEFGISLFDHYIGRGKSMNLQFLKLIDLLLDRHVFLLFPSSILDTLDERLLARLHLFLDLLLVSGEFLLLNEDVLTIGAHDWLSLKLHVF